MALLRGDTRRLIIQMPPRRGKTEIASRRLPAYALGINPDEQIIACSYADALASRINRDVQRILLTPEYRTLFPRTQISEKHAVTDSDVNYLRNATMFEIPHAKGSYRSSGVGGSISGMGFSLGIIDDAFKNSEEAESPVVRQKVWEWWETTFRTRAAPNARIIVIGTRWHEDDLIGRLLRQSTEDPHAEQWELITFPELAEEDNATPYDHRKAGQWLWPERFGPEEMEPLRRSLSAYTFGALYQQNPRAREGNIIKREWFTPYEYSFNPADAVEWGIHMDWGASDEPTADSTVLSVACKLRDGRTLMVWQHAGQWSPFVRDNEAESFCLRWHKIVPNIPIYLEAGIGGGAEPIERLRNRLLDQRLNCMLERVSVSKYNRSDAWRAAAEAGRIKLYAGTHFSSQGFDKGAEVWIGPFLSEVTRLMLKETPRGIEFTGGHDDRLDSAVGVYNKLGKNKAFEIQVLGTSNGAQYVDPFFVL